MTGAIVQLVMVVLGQVVRLAQRLLGRDGRKLLARDPRPPVLFLRSFDDDRAGLPDDVQPGFMLREEQQLEWMFRSVGPCVAVRRPAGLLSESGAARIRFRGSEWQQSVQELIEQSGLVVLRIGVSPGLLWEVRQLIDLAEAEKVLFYVGTNDLPARWDAFRKAAGPLLPAPLPVTVGQGQFVAFNEDWSPTILAVEAAAQEAIDRLKGIKSLFRLNVIALTLPFLFLAASERRVPPAVWFGLPALAVAGYVWMIVLSSRLELAAGKLHGALGIAVIVLGWILRPGRYPPRVYSSMGLAALVLSIVMLILVLRSVTLKALAASVAQLGLRRAKRRRPRAMDVV